MDNRMSSASIITIVEFASNLLNVMRHPSRNKRIAAAIASAAVLSLLYFIFIYKTPEQLASEAKYIPQFFGLTKSDFFGFDDKMDVVDELHSQGRKWEDFGSAHYEIRLCELHPNVRREMEEKGGVDTDSTWVLTKVRGNIRGVLVVKHNSSKAYAHYYQIYEE